MGAELSKSRHENIEKEQNGLSKSTLPNEEDSIFVRKDEEEFDGPQVWFNDLFDPDYINKEVRQREHDEETIDVVSASSLVG